MVLSFSQNCMINQEAMTVSGGGGGGGGGLGEVQ